MRDFRKGFERGFVGGAKTARRVLNTATLGALDQGIDVVKQTAEDSFQRDFKPAIHAFKKPHKAFRPQLNVRESEHIRSGSFKT